MLKFAHASLTRKCCVKHICPTHHIQPVFSSVTKLLRRHLGFFKLMNELGFFWCYLQHQCMLSWNMSTWIMKSKMQVCSYFLFLPYIYIKGLETWTLRLTKFANLLCHVDSFSILTYYDKIQLLKIELIIGANFQIQRLLNCSNKDLWISKFDYADNLVSSTWYFFWY